MNWVMKRKKRSVTELQEASNALHYEVTMFRSLAKGLGSGIAGKSVIGNALLESVLMHVRVLIDFFYADNPRDDDIIAEHFFLPLPDEWTNIRPPKSKTLGEAKNRAHKLLAHLTYTRLSTTQETKKWDLIKITNEIENVLRVFLQRVPKDLLGSRWKASSVAQGKDEQ